MDAGVPDQVGETLRELGHTVILHRELLAEGSPDDLVCATALLNNAILAAIDKDMRRAARRFGKKLSEDRFKSLDLLLFVCSPVQSSNRLKNCASLLDHEWNYANLKLSRRLWIEVGPHHLRTNR